MGLLSKLGGAIKENARDQVVNGVLRMTGNGGLVGSVVNGNTKFSTNIAKLLGLTELYSLNGIDGKYEGLGNSTRRAPAKDLHNLYPVKYGTQREKTKDYVNAVTNNKNDNNGTVEERNNPSAYGLFLNDKNGTTLEHYNEKQFKISQDTMSDIYRLKLPDWSYADFINERGMWQKGLSSIFDEPAWFYFKIFFDFDTNHGLFGGLLNSQYLTSATNSAAKYLYSIRKYHKQEKPKDRINALYKFASILSYINTNAPWYFKGIKNLNNAMVPVVNEFSRERYIEIETFPDAIDMRLSTLMSLYSYACYDSLLSKEIIPENLRKFNMTIILFQAPLRYLHTSYVTNKSLEVLGVDLSGITNLFKKSSDKVLYKSMNPSNRFTDNFANTMSMHAFSFYGCEFDRESLGNMIPGDMSNEMGFNLGSNSIKISYTSVLHHTMNEFYAMMFGDDGFYFNQYSNFQLSLAEGTNWNGYVNTAKNSWQSQINRYKALQDTFSDLVPSPLGNVASIYKKAIDATEALMNGLYSENNILKDLGTNFALGLLGSNMSTNSPQGNLYGDIGINSSYYKDKLEMLKNGVHEWTQAPYRYDPKTGKTTYLHKDRSYSSYDKVNLNQTINRFNLKNWLNTTTQDFASKLNDKIRGMEGTIIDTVGNNNINTTPPYKPNPYNINTAQEIDNNKIGDNKKQHNLVDDPNTWTRVQQPYKYDSQTRNEQT